MTEQVVKIIVLERRDGVLMVAEWLKSLWRQAREFSLLEVAVLALSLIALARTVQVLHALGGAR